MNFEEIKELKDEIQKQMDELWEIDRALSSVKNLIEFFTGVKDDADETW